MWSAVFRRSGPVRQVLPATQEGLGIYQDLGNRDDQITALNEAGALSRTRGDLGRAWSCHQQALDLARQIGSPLEEAHAAGRPGPVRQAGGRTAEAEDRLRQALAIFQRIGAAGAADGTAELDALSGAGPAGESGKAAA
jgi:hypothetical protein